MGGLETECQRWIAGNWSHELTLREWWRRLYDAGFAYPTWPVGFGGRASTAAEARAVAAVLAGAGTVAPPEGPGPDMGAPTLLEHATPDQQRRFVDPLGRGEVQWCQLFSEPGAGSDLASVATRAERDGDHFVVSGQKVWNSRADQSEWGMLLCRTDPNVPKHEGMSFLMIDMRQPGVEVRPLRQMNGEARFCEVFLTDARASVRDVVGPLGAGWKVARTTLAYERASTATGAVRGALVVAAGALGGNLDRSVGELVDAWHGQGGRPKRQPPLLSAKAMIELARGCGATADPVLRDRLVRYVSHSDLYRYNGQRMRDLARAGQHSCIDGPVMKLDLAALAAESRDLSLALCGAGGMLWGESSSDGGAVARAALSSYVPALGGGTNEIQRNVIGERLLGLPREPSVDDGVPFGELRRSIR